MISFTQLFVERNKCILLSLGNENDENSELSRIGGRIPQIIADNPDSFGINDEYIYFMTIGNKICKEAFKKDDTEVSIFYKKDYEELLESNNSLSSLSEFKIVVHKSSKRSDTKSLLDAEFSGYALTASEEDADEYEDSEVTLIGGKPTFIQDDQLHNQLEKNGYGLILSFFESTMGECDSYEEYLFGDGAFYVYAKLLKDNKGFDLSDTTVYWQNS